MSPSADLALLRLRQDAADRWLYAHAARRPAPAHDARHLRVLAQAARHLAPPPSERAGQASAAAEIDAFLDVIARRVLDRPAPDQPKVPHLAPDDRLPSDAGRAADDRSLPAAPSSSLSEPPPAEAPDPVYTPWRPHDEPMDDLDAGSRF